MRVSVEKPGTPAELNHHGVLGMKWGVSSRSSASRAFARKNPSSRSKAVDIRRARAAQHVKLTKYADQKLGSPERKSAKLVYLKSPDRATSLRMTRGEKVVTGILAVGTAAPTLGVAPAVIGLATTGRFAERKFIERKQARGGYK